MSRVPLTKEGEISIKEKLSHLKFVERPQISQAIAEARAHGDLKENAEYHAAKELQGLIEAKINEMEIALANAQVIDVKEIPETGRVVFGSTVTVLDLENDKATFSCFFVSKETEKKSALSKWSKLVLSKPTETIIIGGFREILIIELAVIP